jgi:hypothetical protein
MYDSIFFKRLYCNSETFDSYDGRCSIIIRNASVKVSKIETVQVITSPVKSPVAPRLNSPLVNDNNRYNARDIHGFFMMGTTQGLKKLNRFSMCLHHSLHVTISSFITHISINITSIHIFKSS